MRVSSSILLNSKSGTLQISETVQFYIHQHLSPQLLKIERSHCQPVQLESQRMHYETDHVRSLDEIGIYEKLGPGRWFRLCWQHGTWYLLLHPRWWRSRWKRNGKGKERSDGASPHLRYHPEHLVGVFNGTGRPTARGTTAREGREGHSMSPEAWSRLVAYRAMRCFLNISMICTEIKPSSNSRNYRVNMLFGVFSCMFQLSEIACSWLTQSSER